MTANSTVDFVITPKNPDHDIFELWKKFSLFNLENVSSISQECSSGVHELSKGIKQNKIDYIKSKLVFCDF